MTKAVSRERLGGEAAPPLFMVKEEVDSLVVLADCSRLGLAQRLLAPRR